MVGQLNEANTTKNVFGSTITAGSTISGTTITAGTKLVGHVNESNTTKNVFGNTITAGTDGFIDSTFTNKGVIYANSSGKLVSTALGTVGQVIKADTNGVPVWGAATGSSGGNYWTEHANGNDVYRTSGNVGIANTAPTHTLSVGTVVSIQETASGDVIIVRGDGYFGENVYIAKKLTIPAGGEIVADKITVRSLQTKGSVVIADRPPTSGIVLS